MTPAEYRKDLRRLADDEGGWSIERTRRHIRMNHPQGGTVYVASSPSDRRAIMNVRALLRRKMRRVG